jgi:glucose dehydrogenase/plastocyanin
MHFLKSNFGRLISIIAIVFLIALTIGSGVLFAQSPSPSASPSPAASPPATDAVPPEIDQNAKDWPLPNRDYENTRSTTDSSINISNAATLGEAWHFDIPGIGRSGGGTSTPIILGNTVYFQDLKSNVFAFDLQTGEMKWSKMYDAAGIEGPNGPVVAYGKVFAQSDLYTMVALDANNGNELWSTKLSDVATTGIDIQPTVYDGLVFVSTVPGTGDVFYAPGGRGVLYALDQNTGEIVWQFDTIKSEDLFGHPEVNSGGGAWYPPAIDTATGQMYWSIANPAPFPGTEEWPSGSSYEGDTLYTDSLIAMDSATGELSWYNQVIPHDIFDHDLQISPILTTATVNGQEQEIVISAGKMGKVYAFNRETGNLLWVTPVGEHTQSNELTQLPEGITAVLPGVIGGVETVMACADGVVYVPTINMASDWTPTERDTSVPFDARKSTGDLTALDVNSGQALWIKHFPYGNLGAATVVNDLVLTSTYDGTLYALDRSNGDTVWTLKVNANVNGWPAVAGDTIVWPAAAANFSGLPTGEARLIAFRLGEAQATPTATPSPSPSPSASPAASPSPSPSPEATAPPAASPSSSVSPAGDAATIDLVAQNIAFDKDTITVSAGAQVTVNFNNMDSGIPHNFAVYTDNSANQVIFKGDIITGPATTTYTFTAPTTPGTYFFRCDIHPATMNGQFIVQ